MSSKSNVTTDRHPTSPLVFVIPGVVTGTILVIVILVTICICARSRGWCPRIFRTRRTRQPQKQEIERIKAKIIEQYRRRKRKSRKNDVIPDVIDSTLICAICLDGYVSTISKRHRMLAQLTQCSHHFHFNCIFQWLDRNPSCPVCRTPVVLSDDKIKAIGLQDVCCLDKPMDLMPPVSDHNVIIMTSPEPTTTFIPSSGTPSPRLMAAYLLPSNSDSPSAPSVGTSSTFSTMSSVKSSNTLDRSRINPMPSPGMADPQPSTSTSPPLLLNIANLPRVVPFPPSSNSETAHTPVVIPRTSSQVVVDVEINTLASSFYQDVSSSESSQSDDNSSRRTSSSSSSYDSAHDMWLADNSSCRVVTPSLAGSDNYGSTINIVSGLSTGNGSSGGLDNPAFEEDFDHPQTETDLPEVHRPNPDYPNPSLNCDKPQIGSSQFSINCERRQQRNSLPEYLSTPSVCASSNANYASSLRDLRTDRFKNKAQSRNSIAEIHYSAREIEESEIVYHNLPSTRDSGSRLNSGSDIGQAIPNEQYSDVTSIQNSTTYSDLPSAVEVDTNGSTQDSEQASAATNLPKGPRRTKSTSAHDYAKRRNSQPHSAEASADGDDEGRPRVNSYSHGAKANARHKRNAYSSSSKRQCEDRAATVNNIDWNNRPGSTRYASKPRQQIKRTPSVNERHTSTNLARTLPSRNPPSAVSEQPEDNLHSGSMPDFDRPNRNGRMWQSLSTSLSALSGSSSGDSPSLTSTYM